MRKFLVLAAAAMMLASGSVMAAETGPGCGVGKLVFEGSKGILFQNLAWTTNVYLGNIFSITFGTSGCSADAVILRDKEQEVFVAANLDQLSQDMAQGRGEYVNAMAALMGCDSSVYATFGEMGQQRYGAIFADDTGSEGRVLTNLRREARANPVLANSCNRLS